MQFDSQYALYAAVAAFFIYRFVRMSRVRKQIPELLKSGAVIVDVRTPGEFSSGHVPGSINIPLDQIGSAKSKIEPSKTLIVCCASGTRSGMAVGVLKAQGFKTVLNAGAWSTISS